MEKKYVVPEGMLKAFNNSLEVQQAFVVDGHEGNREYAIGPALEAALGWLAENPLAPSNQQAREMLEDADGEGYGLYPEVIAEWQRRMFLAPEPKVPDAIADLVEGMSWNSETWKLINEAYRRGCESAPKTSAAGLTSAYGGQAPCGAYNHFELAATLEGCPYCRDRGIGRSEPPAHDPPVDPLFMYIMRHFDDIGMDPYTLRNRAEAAIADYKEHVKRNG